MNINLPQISLNRSKHVLPRCEYNMVPVVDSSLLRQNPQFWLLSPRWYGTFFPAILAPLIVVALIAAVVVSVFAFVCVALCLQFCIRKPTDSFLTNPCSVLCRIIHNKNSFWHRRNSQWIRLYLLSRLCHGLFLCHSKVIFVSNRYFQCIIGNRVWPVSIYCFQHVQRLQAHYLLQSVSLPHYWWIWKGFWRP